MTTPPDSTATVVQELDRLAAVYGSGLIDAGPQASLDALVEAAAALLDCPTAMLTILDHDTMHVRAVTGDTFSPIPRASSVCDHAIRQPDGLVVPDLAKDPRFAANPTLAGLRFYAGMPIHAPDAAGVPQPIGALCVIAPSPRAIDERGREALRHLARLADFLIAASADAKRAVGIASEHQRLVTDLARQHRVFGGAERLAGLGSWRLSLIDEKLEWSDGVYRIYGVPVGTTPDLTTALAAYPEDARARVAAALAAAIEGGSFDFEEDFHGPGGDLRRVRCFGECDRRSGEDVAVVGVIHDVTDRYRLETALRHDADTDALTRLANRAAFDKELAAAMGRARAAGTPLLLALIDLDGFKAVNDTLGHAAGDDVLREVGVALRGLAIDTTVIARIGGDEFAMLVEDPTIDDATLIEAIEGALTLSARAGDLTMACGGSVGTAQFGTDNSPRDLFHRADVALYAAKRTRVGDRRHIERRRAA